MKTKVTKSEMIKKEFESLKIWLGDKIPGPRFKEGDIVMFNGYRKAQVLEVIYNKKDSLFKRTVFTFSYRCKPLQGETITRKHKLGISTRHWFYCYDIVLTEEELEEVPEDYETYLCHLIYDLADNPKSEIEEKEVKSKLKRIISEILSRRYCQPVGVLDDDDIRFLETFTSH